MEMGMPHLTGRCNSLGWEIDSPANGRVSRLLISVHIHILIYIHIHIFIASPSVSSSSSAATAHSVPIFLGVWVNLTLVFLDSRNHKKGFSFSFKNEKKIDNGLYYTLLFFEQYLKLRLIYFLIFSNIYKNKT